MATQTTQVQVQPQTQTKNIRNGLVSIRENLETIYNELKLIMAYAQTQNDVYAILEETRKSLINAMILLDQAIDTVSETEPYEIETLNE